MLGYLECYRVDMLGVQLPVSDASVMAGCDMRS